MGSATMTKSRVERVQGAEGTRVRVRLRGRALRHLLLEDLEKGVE